MADRKPPNSARRDARLEARAGDDRRVTLAVSSETPVDRWYGREVLAHEPGAVDLTFFGSGRAPLLHNHDTSEQIGVVESARVDRDGVLRAVVRFGNSTLADEILQDVKDGIRCNSSVGYDIGEYESLPDGNGYRITSWTPLEVSIVSIPADTTVGVGRSNSVKEHTMPDDTDLNPSRTAKAAADARNAERERVSDILALGSRHNLAELAQTAVAEGHSVDRFKRSILANLPVEKPFQYGVPALHLAGERQASPLAMIRALANGTRAGAEFELDESERISEQARKSGMKLRGRGMPLDWLAPQASRSALATTDLTSMQFTEHLGARFVGPLRAASRVLELGATLVPLVQDAVIPKWNSGAAPEWVAEGNAPANSVPSPASIPLSWHGLSATFNVTRRALAQSDPYVDETFRVDATAAIATAVDKAAIMGTGIAPEPKGILNISGIGSVAMGSNGAALTWAKVIELRKAVRATGVTGERFGWLSNHNVEAAMLTTEKATNTARFILDDAATDDSRIALDRVRFSANVPANGTKGTHTTPDLSTLIYGEFGSLLIGMFGVVEVLVDPYTESAAGNVRISLHSAWDFGVTHPEAFGAIRDIIA